MQVTYQIWIKYANSNWTLPQVAFYTNPDIDTLEDLARAIKKGNNVTHQIRAFIDGRYSPALSITPKR